jgi:hypothetical protein
MEWFGDPVGIIEPRLPGDGGVGHGETSEQRMLDRSIPEAGIEAIEAAP